MFGYLFFIIEYLRWWKAFPALQRVGQPCFHWLAPTTARGRCRACWSSAGPPPPPPDPPLARSSSSSNGKILASALLHPASVLSCISTLTNIRAIEKGLLLVSICFPLRQQFTRPLCESGDPITYKGFALHWIGVGLCTWSLVIRINHISEAYNEDTEPPKVNLNVRVQ